MGEPSFWDDPEKASRITKEVDGLKSEVDEYKALETGLDDLEVLQEMAAEEQDESLIPELDENLTKIKENLHHLELGLDLHAAAHVYPFCGTERVPGGNAGLSGRG